MTPGIDRKTLGSPYRFQTWWFKSKVHNSKEVRKNDGRHIFGANDTKLCRNPLT